jgi:hypothetical protein
LDGENVIRSQPTAHSHSLTISTSYHSLPPTAVHSLTAAATRSCWAESFCSESLVTQKIRNRSIERIHCLSSSGVHLPGGRSWPALLRLRSQTVLPKFRRSFSLGAAPSEPEVRAWRKCSHKGRPDGNTQTIGQYLCYSTKPIASAWGAASYAFEHATHTSCLSQGQFKTDAGGSTFRAHME